MISWKYPGRTTKEEWRSGCFLSIFVRGMQAVVSAAACLAAKKAAESGKEERIFYGF